MVYTALIFIYRQPHLTPAEFRTHLMEVYTPLMKRAVGQHQPIDVVFRFPARAGSGIGDRLGAFHMSEKTQAPDAPVVLIGDSSGTDVEWDAIAEYRFKDQLAFQLAWKGIQDGELSAQLVEEETKFALAEKMKVVLLGETVEGWNSLG